MAKINVFRDRNGNVIYQRPTLTPSTKKAEDLLKKTAQKAPKIDTSPRNYGKPVTEKVQIVDYQSPVDTSPRNYGRPLTNKLHLGLYDDEKSLSNVTLGDVTYKPLLSGYYSQKMNEAIGVNRLAGNTNMNTPQIAKYQGLTQKYEPTRFSNPNAPFGGLLNNAPQGALSLTGQQVANLTDEDTVMYAGTGAAAGAMAGSVAGLPGSAITAATGFSAGIAAGVGKNMYEAVFGGTYRDLIGAGVSDSTAYKTALISAGVQSALEMAQLAELAKAAKLLRKQNKAVLAEGIEKILIDRGKGVLKNTGEEVAQEVVAMSGEHYAKSKEGLPTDSWQDNVKRAEQTAIDSALSFGLMSLPGAAYTGNQALQYDKDQKRAQEYIDSLKVAMIKNGITPRSEQPQGTLGPLAAQAANQTPLNSTLITPQDLGNAAIADAKNNWTPGQVRYQNNLYTPPGREKTMTAERKEQSRRQAIQYAKRANIDIVFRDLEEGEGHFEGKFEQYDGENILNPKGRITINNNSYDPFRVVFIHEFTHAMELSKEHYNKYANFAIVNLLPYKYGTSDIAELADAKAKYYASQGVRLTSEEARQEIVSELTSEYMFRDYQAIENLFRYNENIFYWMFENIKNWVKSFAGTQEEQDLARAYKLYARVLKEHQKRPNVVKAAQESDADNDNAQNAAQEGDTQAAASYLFAGERATNADKEALAKAQQMEADNADAETIWKETGWFRGPDKKWRWEIDDSKGEYYQGNAEPLTRLKAEKERYDELFDKFWNSELTKDEEQEMESLWELLKENDIDPKETGTMGDFYKNDDMYAAYPNLKYVGVRSEKMDPNGMYIPDEDTIAISKDITDLGNKDRNKSVLLHETQHAIQRREGFAKGGNLDVAKQYINSAKKEYEQLSKQKDDMFQKMLDGMPEDTGLDAQGNLDDKLMAKAEKLFDEKYAEATSEITKRMQELENKFGKNIGTSQYDAYRNFAGEIEAREVQNRQNMTAQERRKKLPDLGGKEAIVKFSIKDSSGKQLSVDPDINAIKGQLTMNFNMTPEQLDAAAAAIESIDKIDVDKGDAKNKAARERFKVIAQAFQRKYIKETEVDLVGSKFEKTEDLAMAFQVFRNPLFETNRYIFTSTDPVTKKKSIVMQTGVSSRLPGSSLIVSNKRKYNFGDMYFNDIQKKAIAAGADSFYAMHNHPSGNPKPSKDDLSATAEMIRSINLDFGGHIIINSNKYALISFNDDKTALKSKIFDLPSIKKDELLTPSIPHASLNDEFFSAEDLAEIAKKTQMDKEISVLIMATPGNTINGLIEIRSDLYKEADFLEKIEKQAKNFGSHLVVLVTYDKWMYDFAKNNIEQGYFFDSLLLDKKNPGVIDSGRMYYDFPDELWMGKDTGKVEAIDIWPGDAYIPGDEAIAKFSLRELPKVTAHPFLEDDLWSEQSNRRQEAIRELLRENPRFSIDNKIIVGYSPKQPGRYQVTYLDKNGEPLGDSQRDFEDLVMDIAIMRDKDVDVVDDYKVPDVKFSMKKKFDFDNYKEAFIERMIPNNSTARYKDGIYIFDGKEFITMDELEEYANNIGFVPHDPNWRKRIKGYYQTEFVDELQKKEQELRETKIDAMLIDFEKYLEDVGKKSYIRFGKIPESGKSYNFRDKRWEDGVSAFKAYKIGKDFIVLPGAGFFTFYGYLEHKDAYLVEGEEVGIGSDDEPVLSNAKISKKLNKSNIFDIKAYISEMAEKQEEEKAKFSMKEPVEKTKDLIAAHNLTIDNMMKTLDLGGLPAASIAVAKADMGHSEFGEISVLFYPDTIDGKKNKANKVFAGDAWTETFPQISQKVSKQAHERFEKRINSLLAGDDKYKDLGYLNLSYDGVQGEIDRWDSFERAYRNSYLMKLAYLRDTGKEFKPVMMEKNFIEDKPVMKAMLQIIGADKAKEWMDKDEMMSYEPKIREAINKYYESVSPGMTRYDEPMTWAEMDRTVNSLRQYAYYIEDGSPKVMDTRKTKDKLNKTVNEKAYTKWLEDISEGLIEKQGVRNSKDPYTNNGRRTWDQLHDDATLENITKAMTSKDLTGNSFSGGIKFAAGVKKQLGSISDIKKNKDLIKDVSDEEIKAIRDDIDKRLIELVDTVSGNNNDSLFARDGVIDSLLDAALQGKTRDGIKRRLMTTQYGNIDKSKVTDKVVDDFVQLIQDAQAVPTRYFEAKPQRAIGLDEIAMVVIPRKGTKELRAALDARGISYKMYDGTAEDRIAKINGVPDVKFSLKKADDGDAYGDYDGDTSLARIDVWEHTEPEDRSPYFEKGENPARDINVPQRDEYGRKVSRFTRTAAESRALDDKQASELNESVWNGTFSYNVITDQDAINRANDKMERFDNDTLLNGLESKLYDSKIITKDDIALGERLIQEYAKEKNTENLERAIAVVATAGTRAGQAVQAMRLLKKLSPAGQLMALQKQIDTINTDMKLLGDNKVTLSPERAKDITSSDTPEGLEQAVERAKMELYNKVPSRWVDKWNAWRYLSMLGNPKTHIRNVLGNAIFVPVRGMKNVIGASIEAATVKGERSKAIGKLPKIFKEFAAKEFDENKEAIDAGGKENIERNKRVFKSSLLEGMRKANSFALEAEDQKFLKAAYVRSFAGYLKANKISPALVQKLMSVKGTDIEIGDAATAKIFNNARAYAMNEAQKATYRDYSALANALNKFKKTNAATAVLGEGLMPFTKTPINILKRGVEYSPAGILKGIKELSNDVRKADDDKKQQTILKGIDSMASGLSGTAILALGAFLASQGVLSGGGEDDKKERDMAAMMGSQNYSFNMGDVSYTVDWMAPVSLPLFVGVELFNSLESGTVNGFVDIVDAMTSISEPMVNMSMLQGLNRAVTNFDQKGALTSTAADMALGYFSQGVPTLGGQFARTMDATRRTAYVDKNNDIPDTLERPMLNAAAKVPGLSKKLNPYRDSFGRPQTNDSALMRAFENFISPGYVKVKKNDMVLNELQKVYGRTGDKGVLPSLPNKKIGEKNLNATEYDRMAYVKGDVAYRLVEDIIDTPVYREMDYTDKAKMISDAYDYAYAKAKDVVIGKAPDGWIAKAFEAAKDDIKPETYIAYRSYKNSLPDDMYESEKNRQTRELLFEDENLKTKDKNRLDDFLFNDGMYIPKDIKVDYENRESFEITQTSEASQKKWNQVKSLGVDLESYQVVYDIYYKQGIKKNQKIQMAIDAGLTPGQAYGMWDRLYKKKYR